MVAVVSDKCIKCGSCAEVCPVDAFHVGESQFVSNPEACISCGVCVAECPQEAISMDDEAEQQWIDFNEEKSKIWPNATE